jgi:hypothetical protein
LNGTGLASKAPVNDHDNIGAGTNE